MTIDLNNLYAEYVANASRENTDSLHDGVRQYVAQTTKFHKLADAEDATGDIVAEVWRSLPTFNAEASFTTWLHRLVKSSIIDRIRHEQRRPNLTSEDGEYGTAGNATSSIYMDPNDLTFLNTAERDLIRLLIETPDYDDLARKLNTSTVALRGRFARIKKKVDAHRCVSV